MLAHNIIYNNMQFICSNNEIVLIYLVKCVCCLSAVHSRESKQTVFISNILNVYRVRVRITFASI